MEKGLMQKYCVDSQHVYNTMCQHMFHVPCEFRGNHNFNLCEHVNRAQCELMKKEEWPYIVYTDNMCTVECVNICSMYYISLEVRTC